MLPVFYFVAVAALGVVSVTGRRIFVICGFYCFYALLTILDEGNVPHLGGLTAYRALYLILGISLVARLIQDRSFLLQMRRWPMAPYILLIILLLASSIYSRSNAVFSLKDSWSVWNRIVVVSLFWMAASHVQEERDLKTVAVVTVAVSLILSVWVIWSAAQLDFEALRGGIEVNQNWVSIFVLAGAIPLINSILVGKNRLLRLLCLPLLLCVVLGSLILASRGMIGALVIAVILMAATLFRRLGYRAALALGLALALVFTIAMFLPGAGNFLARFQEGDVGTLNDRTLIWSRALHYFTESGLSRMIFGQGLSSGEIVIRPVLPDYANYHNEYLAWLMDQGVVGLVAFVVFLCIIAGRVMKCDHPLKNVMIGWTGFLLTAGLSSTMSDAHLFWILSGVMVGACALPDGSRRSPQPVMKELTPTPPSAPALPHAVEGM